MKKLLLSFSILFCSFFITAQTVYINEDFNATTPPSGWTNSAVSGVIGWQFGYVGSPSSSANFIIDGTRSVYFDDESLGSLGTNNTIELKTPVFNNSIANNTFISFNYFFRNMPNRLDSFYLEVFDGSTWQTIYSQTANPCSSYRGGARCPTGSYPSENIDISAYKNSNCQVRFTYHDGGGLAYYMAIDNVRIYEEISTSVNEIESDQFLTLSPNPSDGNFNLFVSQDLIGEQYRVFNIAGSLISEARLSSQQFQIDLTSAEKGIYFIKINGYPKAKRIVVF